MAPAGAERLETVEVVIGIVGRPHGVRGEVAVAPRTDEPERRFRVGAALRGEGTDRVLTVESSRAHSGRMLVRFVEAPDRSAVESLRAYDGPVWTASTVHLVQSHLGPSPTYDDVATWPLPHRA